MIFPSLSARRSSRKGFTLIEILVSLSIFMILLGVLMSSFFQLYRSQRDANETRKVVADLRTLVNFVQDEMRTKTIDFCTYENGDLCKLSFDKPQDKLVLANKDRTEQTTITFTSKPENNQTQGKITFQRATQSPGKIWLTLPEQVLSIPHAQLHDVSFSLAPMGDTNKYLQNAAFQMQPSVTMHVTFGKNYYLQTTFSSRVY